MGNSGSNGQDGRKVLTAAERRKMINDMDKRTRLKLLQNTGAKYHMKIAVRGARGMGKTTLLKRLQGHHFHDGYEPTPEIVTAHHSWVFKGDLVRIESWEVVDVALPPVDRSVELDLDTPAGLPNKLQRGSQILLDARSVDPYVNTDCICLLFNLRDPDSFNHALSLAMEAPLDIPILFIENFADVVGTFPSRENEAMKVDSYIRPVHYIKMSLKTGAGLGVLHEYLKIPFLLKRQKELKLAAEICQQDYQLATERLKEKVRNPVLLKEFKAEEELASKYNTTKRDEIRLEKFLNETPEDLEEARSLKARKAIEECIRAEMRPELSPNS